MSNPHVLAVAAPTRPALAPFTDYAGLNALFRGKTPEEIIAGTLELTRTPIVTTNFRPMSAVFLHLITRLKPDIPVLWVDSGYNTPSTYAFAAALTKQLNLNLHVYTPRVTVARRAAIHGGIPPLDTPEHEAFTREVKLEPFERALTELAPDAWFTGIRRGQTEYRASLDVATRAAKGTLRIAPLLYWTEVDLEDYLYEHQLPDNPDYVDPTKGPENRECGLQTLR